MPDRYVSFTVIRDPIERLISLWDFTKEVEHSPLGQEIATGKLNIADTLTKHFEYFKFNYEYFIDHHPLRISDDPNVVNTAANSAINVLSHTFFHFGFTENFKNSLFTALYYTDLKQYRPK